ncbi:hypothetical protein [Qipengyuania nanhaisediminis]|jgi:hypothetical protein|uniref:hypothetical protein n=1 Tax=Qipengyuania nanhaisediminis TaxID=604088 RepID=UPI0038B415CC
MIDLDIGGACPRQAWTYALSQALGLPTAPGAGTDALTVGTMDYPSEPALEMVARAAMKARQDSVLALFADERTSTCAGLALIYRTKDGAQVMQVEPCRLRRSRPMVLVTTDRRHAFRLDKRCLLTSCAVPSRAKVERGVEHAWDEIRAAMRTVEVDPAQWEASYCTLFTDAQAFADFMA